MFALFWGQTFIRKHLQILICNLPSDGFRCQYRQHRQYFNLIFLFLAELQRAKHASEAPWVRKIGNPSS